MSTLRTTRLCVSVGKPILQGIGALAGTSLLRWAAAPIAFGRPGAVADSTDHAVRTQAQIASPSNY